MNREFLKPHRLLVEFVKSKLINVKKIALFVQYNKL